MADNLGAYTVRLDGQPYTCIADPERPDADAEPMFSGSYQSLDYTRTFTKRDVPLYLRSFPKGMGFVRRKDEADDGGYAWLEDGIGWLDNGLVPSGRRTAVGSGLGISMAGVIIDSVVFADGHLYAISSTKHCVKFASANPTNVPTFSPALNFAGDATASFRANYHPKAIALFKTAGGVDCIVVSTYNSGTGATRMYTYTTAGGWVEGAADLGYRADSMAVVWWEGRDGVGAYRLLIAADDRTVRQCTEGSDPTVGASYITPIAVAEPGYRITKLVSSGGHAFAVTTGGVIDFNEARTWTLTPYWREQATQPIGVAAALIYDDHLYAARGTSIDRFDLRLGEGVQQRIPGECGPSAFMQDGSRIQGYITALATHNGWLVAPVYDPNTGVSYVCRAKDRRSLNVDVKNPLAWHGAEQMIGAGIDTLISHLRVTADTVSTPWAPQTSRMWMFAADHYQDLPSQTGNLYHAAVPNGNGPISTQISGGSFTFNSPARFYLTEQNWADETATAALRRADVRGMLVSATSTLEVLTRTGRPPFTITDQSTWTSLGTATADSTELTPSTAVEGKGIAFQVVATTPSPYLAGPIFVALSPRAKVIRQSAQVFFLNIVLEKGTELKHGGQDPRKVSTLAGQVTALQNRGAISFTDQEGGTWLAMVEQGIQFTSRLVEDEWRTILRVEVSLVTAV